MSKEATTHARQQQVQGLLLPLSPRQVCDQLGLNWLEANQLYAAGLLSFSPEAVKAMDDSQEAELFFIGTLVAAGCDNAMLTRLLAKLERPYSYRFSHLYYDWPSESWRGFPEPPEEPDPDQVLGDRISSLEEDGDIIALHDIQDNVAAAISRLKSNLPS